MQFKLPEALMMAHGAMLRAHDWTTPLALAEAFPGCGFESWDNLHVIRPGVIAASRLGTMLRLRAMADALPVQPHAPSAEETARILARRNPVEEQDDAAEGADDVA